MAHESDWPRIQEALREMIPRIEGRPCVFVSRYTRLVFVSRSIHGVEAHKDHVSGTNDWVDEERLDYLTDDFVIGYDLLEIGPVCWYDRYFQSWYVFDPEKVARSVAGDHTWVPSYLGLDRTPFPEWAGDFPWRPPTGSAP